jgi:hypothetical protein
MVSQFSNKRKIFSLLGAVLWSTGLGMVLVSCYPGDDITTSQSDIVATVFDPKVDFATKMTYAMPPNVHVVEDTVDGEPIDTLNPLTEQLILDTIRTNMNSLGFTEVPQPTLPPDQLPTDLVFVLPAVTKTTWTGTGCSYYWDDWYGSYPPGYGWCYPYTYSFTTGTLLMAMTNPNSPDKSQPIWVAAINGLIDNTTQAQIQQRVKNAIDQAFKQSPYLGAGK